MIVLVDTNIIISALINPKGTEFSILTKRYSDVEFISSSLLVDEFLRQMSRVVAASGKTREALHKTFTEITRTLFLINIMELDESSLSEAARLIKGLDKDDYSFVAIAIYFNALLWTGDLKLYRGLRRKGFNNIITTKELKEIIKGL